MRRSRRRLSGRGGLSLQGWDGGEGCCGKLKISYDLDFFFFERCGWRLWDEIGNEMRRKVLR
jgi:hypothetical protein